MATNCISRISDDVVFDCTKPGKKGLDSGRVVLINYADIDRSATTTTGAQVTALTLKTGATGYSIDFYKDLASVNSAFSPSTDDIDGFTHSAIMRLPDSSAANALRAHELRAGRFVVVVETKYKGADNKDAFKVYGFENGLVLSEMTSDTAANSGSAPFTLSSQEGELEQYPYMTLVETDYATTLASFNANFANV